MVSSKDVRMRKRSFVVFDTYVHSIDLIDCQNNSGLYQMIVKAPKIRLYYFLFDRVKLFRLPQPSWKVP